MSPAPDSPDPQQIIADLERRLAKRTAERDALRCELAAAAEQQTASAEVLQVINSSAGDLGRVFGAVFEKTLRLCGADLGNLLTYDGECFKAAVGVYGVTWIGPERELSRAPIRPVAGGLLDRLVGGEHFIHTEDVRTEPSYQRNPEFRELVDGGGYQSMAHVALRNESQLLGAIVIFFTERTRLTEKPIALLQNFAAQAVICRSLTLHRATSRRCSRRSSKRPCIYAERLSGSSAPVTATASEVSRHGAYLPSLPNTAEITRLSRSQDR
jgi:hypothetical protein